MMHKRQARGASRPSTREYTNNANIPRLFYPHPKIPIPHQKKNEDLAIPTPNVFTTELILIVNSFKICIAKIMPL